MIPTIATNYLTFRPLNWFYCTTSIQVQWSTSAHFCPWPKSCPSLERPPTMSSLHTLTWTLVVHLPPGYHDTMTTQKSHLRSEKRRDIIQSRVLACPGIRIYPFPNSNIHSRWMLGVMGRQVFISKNTSKFWRTNLHRCIART